MQQWNEPDGLIVHAWMDSSWFTNMWQVTAVDARAGNLSFEDPSMPGFPKGGWQGGRNWRTGGIGNAIGGDSTVSPLIIDNVREELDAVNEWYFDKKARKLYLMPNGTHPPPRLVASKLQTLVSIKGTQDHPVHHVTIDHVGVRDAAYTYLERWGVPSGGDWSLYHGAALDIHGAHNVTIANSRFERLDNNAILLSGYTRAVNIVDNEASWLGANFAAAWGDTVLNDGTAGNQPRGTTLSGNLVREIGIYEKQSSAWFQAKACLTNITGNLFFNGPRAAVNFNDGFGGSNEVSDNIMWNWCRESGDHGPINSWDRHVNRRSCFVLFTGLNSIGLMAACFSLFVFFSFLGPAALNDSIAHCTLRAWWPQAAVSDHCPVRSGTPSLVRVGDERNHSQLHLRQLRGVPGI